MRPSFGTQHGAALVAVERANGGELAPLSQVLWTLEGLTPPGSLPSLAQFTASATLLIELGVVEYVEDQLGLTPEGRKLLRHSGMPNDSRHVALVTDKLKEFEEIDLEPDPSVPVPTEDDVRRAVSDQDVIEVEDDAWTPVLGEEVPGDPYGSESVWVPAVPPGDAFYEPEPPVAAELTESPAHPLLNRLFGHSRRDRDQSGDWGAGSQDWGAS